MQMDRELHKAITDLPEGLQIVYGEGQEPEWTKTAEAKQAADEYCNRTGATPGKVWGAQLHPQLNGDNPKLFVNLYPGTFGYTKLESLGHEDWTFERANSPTGSTKIRISNPDDLLDTNVLINRSDGAENCVLMGLYEGNGVNPSQLIVCPGGQWNDELVKSGDPAKNNLRRRHWDNFRLNIDKAACRPTHLVKDRSMRHIMWEVDYGTWSAEQLMRHFSGKFSSREFSRILIIRDHPEAIVRVNAEFEEQGYMPWKWTVPLAQRAHGLA
jgi:hypothetical protein